MQLHRNQLDGLADAARSGFVGCTLLSMHLFFINMQRNWGRRICCECPGWPITGPSLSPGSSNALPPGAASAKTQTGNELSKQNHRTQSHPACDDSTNMNEEVPSHGPLSSPALSRGQVEDLTYLPSVMHKGSPTNAPCPTFRRAIDHENFLAYCPPQTPLHHAWQCRLWDDTPHSHSH